MMSRHFALTLSIVALLSFGRLAMAAEPDQAAIEFFETKIRPVLVEHCHECHSAASKPLKGGLLVDYRDGMMKGGDSGPALIPEKPEASLILKALKYDGLEMPPRGKLPANVVANFEQWIKMGAPDPREQPAASAASKMNFAESSKFWSFQPPQLSTSPDVRDPQWARRELDRFVLHKLEQAGVTPNPPADRHTLIRRAYFDVIGLPPTLEEVQAFVNDTSPQAFEAVVNRLLDSPHYGERWGRHWLDVARYAEDQAHTFKARNYPQGYRYRDWIVDALNHDMPYDRFITEQIAGDLLGSPSDPGRLSALGLFALGPVYYQDNGEQAKALADEWDDRVDTLTRGILGLTITCARCHDHKFDPITTADYYALAGIFASSDYQERPIVPGEVLDRKAKAEAAMKAQQLQVDRFLNDEARKIRVTLLPEIPTYLKAAWKAVNQRKGKSDDKKLLARIAKEEKVSEQLLKRWFDLVTAPAEAQKSRPYLSDFYEWLARQELKPELATDAESLATIQRFAADFQSLAESKASSKETLFAEFGENYAFANQVDVVPVVPGIIPLGNLFDDTQAVTSLSSALSTDKFLAAASSNSLGVDRIAQGWGKQTQIAANISFDFVQLGSDGQMHGGIINDGWDASGGLRTIGQSMPSQSKRVEQGIGMHANALITFDLDKIRAAGQMPADQTLVFRSDRAGLNDDVFGNGGSSAHMAVVVSRKPRQADDHDCIIAGYVNGTPVKTADSDGVYYFADQIPPELKANGEFARFEVPIPADASYLTLVSTGAGTGPGENTISSDHTVFSGARLEMVPLPEAATASASGSKPQRTETEQQQAERDAHLLSTLFSDQGLLALPGSDADGKLSEPASQRLAALRSESEKAKKEYEGILVPMAHSLTEGNGRDLKIYLQGNPARQGDVVPRSMPAVFTSGERKPWTTSGSGRSELAKAIASRDNPLTARVIVNRVWQSHFGFGIVRTPSNFGHLGERPTHPELLDNLAIRFMESGWSLKMLHREILLSSTYQQSSAYRKDAAEIDPENRLLWRMNRRRLEVEPWRDAILAVTGQLDRTVGGPPVDLANADNRRRTLYAFVSRHQLNELLRLFDFPDPNITSDLRSVTTVPLQQLFVLNSEFMSKQAKALVTRLNANPDQDDEAKIRQLFGWLYGRIPTPQELELGQRFVQSAASKGTDLTSWEQYALALLGTNEFSYID